MRGLTRDGFLVPARELIGAGLIEQTSKATFGDDPKAACYRLLDRKCDITGMRANQPSNVVDFPQINIKRTNPKGKVPKYQQVSDC